MRTFVLGFVIGALLVSMKPVVAAESERIPLHILYLSRTETVEAGRTKAFASFLRKKFQKCTVAKRDAFQPKLLDGVDVVLLDWPQSERPRDESDSPIGKLEDWKTPTVFLGSAGLLMANAWKVIGDAG